MGLFDLIRQFVQAVDSTYDRRVKAASNISEYGQGHGHAPVEEHAAPAHEAAEGAHAHEDEAQPLGEAVAEDIAPAEVLPRA